MADNIVEIGSRSEPFLSQQEPLPDDQAWDDRRLQKSLSFYTLNQGQCAPPERGSFFYHSSSTHQYPPKLHHHSCSTPSSDPWQELQRFQSNLSWLGFGHLTLARTLLSCFVFVLLAAVVPIANAVCVRCPSCDAAHKHPFEKLVQLSQSALATISFICLLHMLRTYGLREVLLPDDTAMDSAEIQLGYKEELRNSFRLLAKILAPFFAVELIHEVLWFDDASVEIPLVRDEPLSKIVMCTAVMVSWAYRTGIFLLLCVVFKLVCSLQTLRLQGYYRLLEQTPPVFIILQEHMRLREQLLLISHRFRIFMVFSLFTITFFQFLSLFCVTAYNGTVSFARIGDLLVCCAVQLIGFVFCLHGAAKITHRAQRIVSIVSQWHAVATCIDDAVGANSNETLNTMAERIAHPLLQTESYGDLSACLHLLQGPKDSMPDSYSFQKRNALVTYLQHCSTGISVYGFVLDRGCLYTIFAMELSIVLWILGKTITLIK